MATGCSRYLVYTLRPWQVGGGKELTWRATLESPTPASGAPLPVRRRVCVPGGKEGQGDK